MAFRADYLIRETGQNLFRNPSLSIATILTVAVSLSLMGASLLVQQGVGRINNLFRDGVDFIVWMDVGVLPEQVSSTQDFLNQSPFIRNTRYIDRGGDLGGVPALLRRTSPRSSSWCHPDQLPTSFEVTPQDADDRLDPGPGRRDRHPGRGRRGRVRQRQHQGHHHLLPPAAPRSCWWPRSLSAVAAALLMYNSIRTAVFARRREIEVMRLVGATKWFIRIPFMLEGLLQGVSSGPSSASSRCSGSTRRSRTTSAAWTASCFGTSPCQAPRCWWIGASLMILGRRHPRRGRRRRGRHPLPRRLTVSPADQNGRGRG